MQYGCIGEHLPHSFSKIIHEKIGGYSYELKELAPEELDGFMRARAFCGINVTIPYKEKVIPYLDDISPRARAIGAVNTIVGRAGRLYGDNTDFIGLKTLLERNGIDLSGAKVLIAGTGGTSKTAQAVAESCGAARILRVSRTGREGAISYDEAYAAHADADVIINTTPCGTFPEVRGVSIDLRRFTKLRGVADAVYNPLRTELLLTAAELGIPAAGGLYMLVAQAVAAAELFTESTISADVTERIFRDIYAEKENIVLIGMPSCGKTTVGRLLAEMTGRRGVDVDDETQRLAGMHPSEYIKKHGAESFRALEAQAVRELAPMQGVIISTGGGTVLRAENVRELRRNGRLYWLDRPCGLLTPTPDRPLSDTPEKLRALYDERRDKYLAAADERITADVSAEECAENILASAMRPKSQLS